MTRIVFAPAIPLWLLAVLAAIALIITLYAFAVRAQGAWARALAFAILLAALGGPLLVHEKHVPLPDIVLLLTDRSQSMGIGTRTADAEKARVAIKRQLAGRKDLILRESAITTTATGENNGTQAFAALGAALGDIPPERVAGTILISDGEVHDTPQAAPRAPLHALIVGKKGERDRKLTLINAARFAIVGRQAEMQLRVDDLGGDSGAGTARLSIRIDGKDSGTRDIPIGQPATIRVPVGHEGENVVELSAEPGPAELTLENNRTVVTVSGVRDRLRVLLVSGVPHAGERVWRNLLKADPSVDLVHFTILRPPDKQDDTPIGELSLIAFPTRELFLEKLDSFDLVIFDRYSERGILPMGYFENIAAYVQNGGALLLSSGPELAGADSIYRTPLASVLPAQPTGEVTTGGFKPMVTEAGMAHPVTRDLPGHGDGPVPAWGRWFRIIGAQKIAGQTVMSGPGGRPLLVLDQMKKGRVAELMSDQAWLWARGFEGGGPQAELLRRLAHWLMKEPELEAENLSATVVGGQIQIIRRSMAAAIHPVAITLPSGQTVPLVMNKGQPGIWRGVMVAQALGLYRIGDGILSTVTAVGPLNPREVADMRATDTILKPIARTSGGDARWLNDGLPQIRRVGRGESTTGRNFIGLKRNDAYRVTELEQQPLLPPWAALLLIAGSLLLCWKVEGR